MPTEAGLFSLCAGPLCLVRPLWLLALVPGILLIVGYLRNGQRKGRWQRLIAPHLLPHLLRAGSMRSRKPPVILAAATLFCLVLALSGPFWRGGGEAGAGQNAPLVILLDLSPEMSEGTGALTLLARARFKLRDLLNERRGAPTALLVFAGTAHTILPLTEDSDTLDWYLQALDPALMPVPGYAPLAALERVETLSAPPDSDLLLVTRRYEQNPGLENYLAANGRRLAVLALDNGVQAELFSAPWARLRVVPATLDNADLEAIHTYLTGVRWRGDNASVDGGGTDLGYPLVFLFTLLLLCWFRPGMVMRWQ